MATMRKKVLGRGLDALLASRETEEPSPADLAGSPRTAAEEEGILIRVSPDRLTPGVHQPRIDFDEEDLAELAESVKRHGVIQPLLVRRSVSGGYEIVAGERRWRAARLAAVDEIPAILIDAGGDEALELAIVENVQRADLNPMEEAAAYAGMMERLNLTQEEVAARVGKDRSTVANYVRLLNLPPSVQESVAAGLLSMGHARALLSLRTDEETARHAQAAIDKRLSVRQLETRVRGALEGGSEQKETFRRAAPRNGPTGPQALYLREAAERLRSALGTKVAIQGDENNGKIEIEYYTRETLEGLLQRLC